MSSFLSQTYQPGNPLELPNVDIVRSNVKELQTKYDSNKAILDSTMAKYEMLKGLSTTDNEYISTKIREAESAIDAYSQSNGDLSRNTTRDTMLSAFKSIYKDPIVLNAIEQKTKYDTFNTEVAKRKEKGDGSYSDMNYQDALNQGGVQEYMEGKTKKLGNLSYTPYVNAPKDLSDAVGKWAKENGYQTKIDSVNKGLYYENTKSEILTKDEILNYIDTIADPSIKAQMDINARASYGRMSDIDFKSIAKNKYEQLNQKDELLIAEQKAKLKTANKEQSEILNSNISILEERKTKRKEQISKGEFDRNEQYGFYKNDLYGSIAEAYDRNNVIDIDYDTTLLDIEKFKFDVQYKTEDLALKREANKLKREENNILLGATNGTAMPVIPEEDEVPKSNIEQIKTNVVQTEADLRNILEREDKEFQGLETEGQKVKYIRALMNSEGNINLNSNSPMSNNVANAVANHKNNYKVYSKYSQSVQQNLDGEARKQYTEMRGATSLNLNNLGSSMPFTASFLKEKRDFNSLRPDEQEMVRYERALSQAQFDSNMSSDERLAVKSYLTKIKARNKNNEWFQTNIKTLGEAEEVGGSVKNFWTNLMYGTFIKGVKNVMDKAVGMAGYAYESAFGNEQKAKENLTKDREQQKKDWGDIVSNYKTFKKSTLDSSPIGVFYDDTNISEVDTKGDSKSGDDLSSVYRKALSTTVDDANKTLAEYLPTVAQKQSFSFSTIDKAQKPTATVLGQIVQKNGGIPSKGENNYNLEYFANANAFKITYLNAEGEQEQTDFIDKKLIPTIIADKYQTSLSSWSTDLRNPKAVLPSIQYNRPKSREEGEKMIETIATTNPDSFTDQEIYMLMDSPMFQSPKLLYDKIYQAHPEIKGNAEKENAIKEVVNSTIKTRTRRLNESTFQIQSIFVNESGEEIGTSRWENIGRYDPQNNLKIQIEKVSSDLNTQINAVIQ